MTDDKRFDPLRTGNLKSTTVYLQRDQWRELKKLSEKLEISMAVMIRRGIDVSIEYYKEKLELFERSE